MGKGDGEGCREEDRRDRLTRIDPKMILKLKGRGIILCPKTETSLVRGPARGRGKGRERGGRGRKNTLREGKDGHQKCVDFLIPPLSTNCTIKKSLLSNGQKKRIRRGQREGWGV